MILQALVKYYNDLADKGEISRPGWGITKTGYMLCINTGGELLRIVPTTEEKTVGEKTETVNKSFNLPAAVKKTSGVSSNFLWENSSYILGYDNKGKPKRTLECFEACKALHKELLSGIQNDCAVGILNYFERWNPESDNAEALDDTLKESLNKGANLIFNVDGVLPQDVPEIAAAWQRHYDSSKGETGFCLVSGEEDTLETVHPAIKSVWGAQPSGAALVSFNAKAYESYSKEKGENAPIGKRAAFAYTTAINHLVSDRESVQHIGDTTVVCWADGAEHNYTSLSLATLFGKESPKGMSQEDLMRTVERLAKGLPCEELNLDANTSFYILGIAPNAARLSVRFFVRNSFGNIMKNINEHHERMRLVGSEFKYIPLWVMLRETANLNSKDKAPSPIMAGAVARAIFEGARYPAALLQATVLRIRSERRITHGRAAIIKAYYLKNTDNRCPKEVLTVSLNESSRNVPYTIGRLFAIYEAVQEDASPGINATIKDKYFNSVASTPSHIVPILSSLCEKHLKKLDVGRRIFYEKKIGELFAILGEELPARFTLPEQGSFYLGYYHQKEKRFEKKENK